MKGCEKQILFGSPRGRGVGLPAAFVSEKTRSWNLGYHLGDFPIFWIQKGRGISPEVGSTNFQPVMFDMNPFGGKVSYLQAKMQKFY